MGLRISQVLITIQGEGRFLGTPSILIRTQGCNLRCPFCDSAYTWNDNFGYELREDNIVALCEEIYNKFSKYKKIRNLLLTGGEPLLHFDNPIYIKFINILNEKFIFETIEVETNGTIKITKPFNLTSSTTDIKFNISPKTNNDEIVKYNLSHIYDEYKVELKLVHISDEFVLSSHEYYNHHPIILPLTNIKNSDIRSKILSDYEQSCQRTLKFCIENGYDFSPREHILLFDKNINEFMSFDLGI